MGPSSEWMCLFLWRFPVGFPPIFPLLPGDPPFAQICFNSLIPAVRWPPQRATKGDKIGPLREGASGWRASHPTVEDHMIHTRVGYPETVQEAGGHCQMRGTGKREALKGRGHQGG